MGKSINIKGKLFDLQEPKVMAIVNLTPDSFYARSRLQNVTNVIEQIRHHIELGAAFIDIGAQSTNPQSPLISAGEETARLTTFLPTVQKEFPNTVFSIDTFYSQVAQICIEEYGFAIVNDISGGDIDTAMFETVARLKVPYILMHMRGMPQTMQNLTDYKNLPGEIIYCFSKKIDTLRTLGVCDIILDPGFGFSKTMAQNYELMRNLQQIQIFQLPLLVGISRKSMIYKLLNTTPEESLNATTALHLYALLKGAGILRVHDVKPAMEAIALYKQLKTE